MAEDSSSYGRRLLPVDPICITPDHVIGLVESVYSVGGRIDSEELNKLIDVDMDILTHAIDIAEALGLIVFDKGDIKISELGVRVATALPKEVERLIGDRLVALEPFATLADRMKQRGRLSLTDTKEVLASFYGEGKVESALNCLWQWWRYFMSFSKQGIHFEPFKLLS